MVFGYALLSSVAVSLLSLLVAIPFFVKKKVPHSVLIFLMSVSVGTLLGSVFIHFLPEAFEHGESLTTALVLIGGFLTFFLIEKLIHHHHNHKKLPEGEKEVHSHGFTMAPLNLIGDGIHNFIDGLVIAGSYLVSIPLGIAATISILFHELPQELADFGILLYSGFSKKKALFFNVLSAATAILGVAIGFLLPVEEFTELIIPFAAGVFLYIAASNLTPELHKHCGKKDTFIHILAILLGVALLVALTLLIPEHAHA